VKKATISAKERRDMKKGNKVTVDNPSLTDNIAPSQQKPTKKPANNKSNEPKQQPKSTRGRKGKSKKIKEKYGDQDEEERQLRMEILGVSVMNELGTMYVFNFFFFFINH
jgi:predicted ATP-dependent protease